MACRVSSWLLILCVCSSVVTLVFGAQHLTVMPTDQTAVVGDTITFHCTVAEKKGFVTWLQGGSPLNFDTMMSTGNTDYTIVYSTTAEGEAYDLQITNVGHDDANTYECTVTQGGGDGGAMSGQVVLTVIDSVPQSFSKTPSDATTLVGNSAVMECTVSDKEGTVIWSKDGVDISSDATITNGDNRFSITGNQNNGEYNLQLVTADTQDTGTYACRVTAAGYSDQIGPDEAQASLFVQAPQAFTTEPTNTDELEGNDVTLFCSVSNKAGQIVWSLDGEDISSDSTITTSTSGYTINSPIPSVDYNLKIESVRPEHAGNYVCSVTSANGHPAITSGTAVLTVEPRQTFQTEPSDTTVVEGEATTLQCSVNNKHGTVSWKKGSDIISEDTTTTSHYAIVSTTPGFDYDLYIDNTTLDDSGDYECYVSDALNGDTAITSRSAILTVYDLEIQSFATTPSDAEVVEGNVIILQCTVDHKEGFVIWSKDGVDITNDATVTNGNPKYSVVGDVGNGEYHLQIDSVALSDAGTFKCQITEADNSPAIETAEVTLDVIGRQAFTDEPVDITAVEGDSVILTCSVSNKHGALSWIKDGDVINFDLNITNDDEHFSIMSTSPNTEYNLKIDNIQIRHEGSYICKVSDSVDGDSEIISQSAIVTVHDLESQNFTSSPVDAKIVEGNTLTLRCSVENKEGSVIWSKDNVDISTDHTVTNGDSRYSIRGNSDNGRYNLQIRDVALSDEGYYECRVTAADNSLEIKTPKAFIDVLPSQSFTVVPTLTVAVEGQTIIFDCAVSNKHGVLSWKKDGTTLSNDATIVAADSRLTILNPSVGEYNLQIDDVSVNDVGSYVCFVSEDTAIGDSSIQSNPANLIMQDAAVQNMTSVPEDTETITGLEVSLECSVFHKEGNVIWSKDGVDISNDVFITNGDSQLSIVGDQSAGEYYLRISSAALSDTGVYQCRVTPADNSEEIISPQAILTVEEPQSFIVEPVEEVAVEGDVIVLTCSVENKHGTLHWKKDGAILTEDMQITANDPSLSVVTSQPGREYNLQINALSMEHMGEYLCHVTSAANGDVAIDSDSVKLTVYDAAVQDFTTVPVDTNIVAGKSVMLDCVVSNKEGDVIWSKDGVDITKDGTVINGDARYSIAGDATNGHYNLQIDDAEVTDTGEFQCRATAADNSDEISTPKIDLVVDDPQTFIEEPDDATITEGETVIFNCSVSNKHGTLHWKKDRNTISTDMTIDVNDPNIAIVSDNPGVTYNLKMKNVIPDDAGVYVCYVTEATNGDSSIESQAATLTVFDLAIQQLGTTPSDLDLEVVEGSTVVLQFSVQHKEGFVIWSKDGADISNDVTILNGDPRLSMVGDHTSGEYNLQITDLSAEDSGSYQARVTSADNSPEIHAEAYTLSVEASQSFTTEPSDIGEVEGETITLPCSVSNKHGSLSWKKDGVVISNDGVISVSDPRLSIVSPALGSDYNLRIDNINLGDDGEYTCYVSEADNGDAAIESGIAKLTVYDSEVQNFTTVPSDVILEVGETVLLTCTVYHKEGTLIWSRNGEDISNDVTITTDDNNYSIIGDHDSGEYNLQITNAQPVDSGQYECWVTEGDNSDQIRSGEVSVSIRGPDSPLRGYPKCTSSTEDKLILGETLILVCESIGGNPAANLRWVQDGMIQEGIAMDTNTEVRLSLVLTVTEDLLGTEFICQSNHPTFYIPETCSIGPLDIDISQTQVALFSKDTDKTTKEGANMVMECTALNKAGTLHWIKDGQMISSDTVMETGQYDANRYSIRGDQSVGEYFLNIDDVRKSDAGTYYCLLSSNEDGMPMMSSKAINFHIDDAIPPNINFPQCTISSDYVIDGDTVLLTCITKGGDPPATLQWDQDGQNREGIYIDESIVGLQINASAEVNGNTFTCTSSHSTFENPRTCVIELRVESRPTDTGTSVGFWITLIFLIIALIVILLILFFCVYKRREDEKEYNQQGYKRNNDIESSLASLPSRDELYTHTGKPTGDGLYINRPVINTDFTDVPADAMNVGAGVSQTVENKPVQIREKRKTDEATKKPKKKKKSKKKSKRTERYAIDTEDTIDKLERRSKHKKKDKYEIHPPSRSNYARAESESEMTFPSYNETHDSGRHHYGFSNGGVHKHRRFLTSTPNQMGYLNTGYSPLMLRPMQRKPIRVTPSPVDGGLIGQFPQPMLMSYTHPESVSNVLSGTSDRNEHIKMLREQLRQSRT